MLKKMTKEIAEAFAFYAERRDTRFAFLAHKAETTILTDAEITEFVLRAERLQECFFEERAAILGEEG